MARSPSRCQTTSTTTATRTTAPAASSSKKKNNSSSKSKSSRSSKHRIQKRPHWLGIPRKEREETIWEERFQELSAYKRINGHCNTPSPDHPEVSKPLQQLATWVLEQRRRHRQGKMPTERFEKLQQLGMDWDRRKTRPEELWNIMYDRLKAYKTKHGDCLVPYYFDQDEKLGRWVSLQRWHHSAGNLSKARETKLNQIGFVWNAQEYMAPNILKGLKRKQRERQQQQQRERRQQQERRQKEQEHQHSAAGGGSAPGKSSRKRIRKSTSNYGSSRRHRVRRRTETTAASTPPQEPFTVGTWVMKYFDGDGWFLGEIISSNNTAGYRIVYEDGDREFYSSSEQLMMMEMVENARDVTADEILLDPDADVHEDDDTEMEDDDDDALFSNEILQEETKKEEMEDELLATPDINDEDSLEEYASAMEELSEEEEDDKEKVAADQLFSESNHDEEKADNNTKDKEKEEEQEQPPKPAPNQSRFSLLQNRIYSFFGSKTK